MLPEAREAPEVKAHAGAGDWVEIGGLCHHARPAGCTIRERLSFIRHVVGVAAVKESGQVHHRPGSGRQPPKRPFNSLGCIVCRSGLYSLPVFAEERQDALENQY